MYSTAPANWADYLIRLLIHTQRTNKKIFDLQYKVIYNRTLDWIGLDSLFNGISTFVSYLMPKTSWSKNSSGTI